MRAPDRLEAQLRRLRCAEVRRSGAAPPPLFLVFFFIFPALCGAALIRLPSGAALCEEIKAQASSREGADLAQTGYCTWPLMLLDTWSQ